MILLGKRVQACNILSSDQQVDIMRPFICQDRFEIHHMSHNRVFIGNTHASVDLAGLPGDF